MLDTLISEHQRDLVGSSVARDFPIIVVNLTYQLETLLRRDTEGKPFLSRITIDKEACERNFSQNAHLTLAEPFYAALQLAGYEGDAHEVLNRHAVPISAREKVPLLAAVEQLAQHDRALEEALQNIPDDMTRLFFHPSTYTGMAREKALEIADMAERELKKW